MRGLKWGLCVLGAVLVVLVSVAGIAVAVVDPNDYKPQIVEAVRGATGRTLSLNGPLRISRSLWPTVEVSDVTLSNVAGGSRADIARVERIQAELSLPSLLRREIEVVRLTLTGPNILFEEVGGAPNWVFDVPGGGGSGGAPGQSGSLALRVRAVAVRNGMVTWRFPARTKVLGIRSLEVRHAADGGPVEGAGVFVYGDNAAFSAQAKMTPTGGLRDPWTAVLGFQAFDTTASGTGTVGLAGAFDLEVQGQAGALERLNALLPEMRLPPVHGVEVSARLRNGAVLGELPVVSAARLRLDDADLGAWVPGLALGKTEVSLGEAGGAAAVTGVGRFAGQGFSLAGSVGVPARPDGRVSLPVDLVAKGVGAEGSLALKGAVALRALRFAGLDAAASLRTPALEVWRKVVTEGLPALTDVRFDGRVVVPADGGSVSFKGAKLLTQEGDVAGDWTLGTGAGLRMEGNLVSGQLDMDAMLEAFGVALPSAPATGAGTGPVVSTAPLAWGALRGPVVELTARIGAMGFQGETWRDVRFTVSLKGGRLRVAPVAVSLPGGALQMSFAVDASQAVAPVSLEMHAPGVPLGLIGRYAGLPGGMSGAVRVDAALHGAGRTPHEIAASLDGTVSATMVGGKMTNAAFVMLTKASLEALGIRVPGQGETALRCMGVVGVFAKGVGRFRTIALDTSYLQLDGKGQVDFGAETVALKLRPLTRISGSMVAVPVVVEGPFHSVSGRLDADGLDKLGLFLDGLFGGDESTACLDAGLVPGR